MAGRTEIERLELGRLERLDLRGPLDPATAVDVREATVVWLPTRERRAA